MNFLIATEKHDGKGLARASCIFIQPMIWDLFRLLYPLNLTSALSFSLILSKRICSSGEKYIEIYLFSSKNLLFFLLLLFHIIITRRRIKSRVFFFAVWR